MLMLEATGYLRAAKVLSVAWEDVVNLFDSSPALGAQE